MLHCSLLVGVHVVHDVTLLGGWGGLCSRMLRWMLRCRDVNVDVTLMMLRT